MKDLNERLFEQADAKLKKHVEESMSTIAALLHEASLAYEITVEGVKVNGWKFLEAVKAQATAKLTDKYRQKAVDTFMTKFDKLKYEFEHLLDNNAEVGNG